MYISKLKSLVNPSPQKMESKREWKWEGALLVKIIL